MKRFVIKSTFTWVKKNGDKAQDVSYFQRHNNEVLSLNIMTSKIEEAKQYEFSTEAQRDKRKYFPGDKSVKVISVNAQS